MSKAGETFKIVGLCVFASIAYGIVHDQITARIYLPYFTVWHPHLIDSEDPTVVALLWGVIATWWVGLLLSIPLSCAVLLGRLPSLPFRRLVRGVAWLLATMAVLAALSGTISYLSNLQVLGIAKELEPGEDLRRFTAVLVTHNASYLVGFLGGIALCFWAIAARYKLSRVVSR